MGDSAIDWCDKTWPIVNGCDRVSPGCDDCWAARQLSTRQKHQSRYAGLARYDEKAHVGKWTGVVRCDKAALDQPRRWRKPRLIFVAPNGDLFHPSVPFEFIGQAWMVMRNADHHAYELLTKRPERMVRWWQWMHEQPLRFKLKWLPKVLPGVTAENQKMADLRIPQLLKVPAALHFVSYEPLLGPIDIERDLCEPPGLGWVIGGGESGPNARPCHPDWARGLRDQCQAAGVPFMWKQNGEYGETSMHPEACKTQAKRVAVRHPGGFTAMIRVGKKEAGRLLDGMEHMEFPEVT